MSRTTTRPTNAQLAGKLSVAALLMFGFGFAMVPLYDVFCEALGINGKPTGRLAYAGEVDRSRTVTVQFLAMNDRSMDWQFQPLVKAVKVHPGEPTTVKFYAKNPRGMDMVGQAVPSVAPGEGALYLQKTECFCFNQQTLKAGESIEMPVRFHVDPALPEHIHTLTLSYTLYNVTDKAQVAAKVAAQ
ncbi:MAG: cytochrome c oxidase assembly protein [Gammaproteobacteria bacterium]|nr:cytochrome c oxidase assembly protein [Gammaproteobacteria bacterium]